ncbi:MAG: glycosyltransferase [Bacteroidetes bacterium]|uniref:glycosyltransferase n=1 Tax=Phnomibacter sp. TaxID=2836217 RepID=UPI002FDD9CCC|nr:glycosyltransferase [Bacteroidota bacterium]
MKVVHVCLNKNGGAAAAAWRLHLALLQSGVNSWFYTLEPRGAEDPAQQWICWKEPKYNCWQRIKAYSIRKYWQWQTAGSRKELHTMAVTYAALLPGITAEMVSLPDAQKNILEDPLLQDADIIHLHWVALFIKQHEFFRRARGRYALCWTLHDLNPISGLFHYHYDVKRNPQAALLEQEVVAFKLRCMQEYGQSVVAIAPNTWMQQQIQQSDFAAHMQAVNIPYCLPKQPAAPVTRLQARRQLGIDAHQTVLLAVVESTTVARKQTNLIYEVAPQFPNIQWEIAGHYTNGTLAGSNMRLHGFISNNSYMQLLYTAADAVVIPSAEDNLPNVMLEAFACGTPVLSFAVGGMQQYVVPGLTGYTSTNMSAEGLQQLIQQWLDAPEKPEANAIRQFAQQHFDAQHIAQQHQQLYQQLLTTLPS